MCVVLNIAADENNIGIFSSSWKLNNSMVIFPSSLQHTFQCADIQQWGNSWLSVLEKW